ncbi:MAG: radical SAM protein [Clostridia bacterium]|nr:radical SAM protein [Clostridia bacterium]
MNELVRYARIETVMPREFLLLQGTGCRWGRCAFCDYHLDRSSAPFEVNRPILQQVTGELGVLDIINSGSAPELDEETLQMIRQVAEDKAIHTLWFEAHWQYHEQLEAFARQFPKQRVYFRCGAETFDPVLRKAWNKGIPETVTPADMARYFRGACLLVGVQGQTRAGILKDLALARRYFSYYSVNLFVPNSTTVKRDAALAKWFIEEVAPGLQQEPGVEVLIENTDLGVG